MFSIDSRAKVNKMHMFCFLKFSMKAMGMFSILLYSSKCLCTGYYYLVCFSFIYQSWDFCF